MFFWFVLFAPLLAVYGGKVVPYFRLLCSILLLETFLWERMLFWPFSSSYFGFNNFMISVFDVALETVGLLLAAGVMYFNEDLKRLLSVDRRNVLMFFSFFGFGDVDAVFCC